VRRRKRLWRNHLIVIMGSFALCPAALASPGCDCAVLPLAIVEKFPDRVIPGHCSAPPPPRGGRVGARGRSSPEKRISPEQEEPVSFDSLSGSSEPYGSLFKR
jgi:hypothetical protein